MEITETFVQGLFIIQPRVFEDARGHFFESWSEREFEKAGIRTSFVQDNQSLSGKGVLRGLHFQAPPSAQGKLVRVVTGAVLDVAVDIRKDSKTYGKHVAVTLSGKNKTMFYIPPGFAHGFVTLEENTIFAYKCTGYYDKSAEGTLLWNDPLIGIEWGIDNPLLSDKDKAGIPLNDFKSPF